MREEKSMEDVAVQTRITVTDEERTAIVTARNDYRFKVADVLAAHGVDETPAFLDEHGKTIALEGYIYT